MSRSIFVSEYGKLTEEQRTQINQEFVKIHPVITITANLSAKNDWKGELVECKHGGVEFLDKGKKDEFIVIPCHWDYEHAIQTAKDITDVLLRLEIDEFTIRHSY